MAGWAFRLCATTALLIATTGPAPAFSRVQTAVTDLEVMAVPGGQRLDLRVVDRHSGAPITGVGVTVTGTGPGYTPLRPVDLEPLADGRYAGLLSLAPGRWDLSVTAPAFHCLPTRWERVPRVRGAGPVRTNDAWCAAHHDLIVKSDLPHPDGILESVHPVTIEIPAPLPGTLARSGGLPSKSGDGGGFLPWLLAAAGTAFAGAAVLRRRAQRRRRWAPRREWCSDHPPVHHASPGVRIP